MIKNILIFIFLAMVFQFSLSAQVADEIEKLLDTEAINYGQAARFILQAAEVSDSGNSSSLLSQEAAFRLAEEKSWLPKNAGPEVLARADGVSLLLMKSFGLKGGIFYSLFKNPHYAYRELEYRDVIHGRAEPKMTVSGDMLLYMVNRILGDISENQQ